MIGLFVLVPLSLCFLDMHPALSCFMMTCSPNANLVSLPMLAVARQEITWKEAACGSHVPYQVITLSDVLCDKKRA